MRLVIPLAVTSSLTFCVSQEYEEVIIPPARPVPPRFAERLVLVNELDDICKPSFPVCHSEASLVFVLSYRNIGLCEFEQDPINRISNSIWNERKYAYMRYESSHFSARYRTQISI